MVAFMLIFWFFLFVISSQRGDGGGIATARGGKGAASQGGAGGLVTSVDAFVCLVWITCITFSCTKRKAAQATLPDPDGKGET